MAMLDQCRLNYRVGCPFQMDRQQPSQQDLQPSVSNLISQNPGIAQKKRKRKEKGERDEKKGEKDEEGRKADLNNP